MMGPGTRGALVGGDAGSQVRNIAERVAIDPRAFPGRARAMLQSYLPGLLGAAPSDVTAIPTGHAWLWWPLAGGLVVILGRGLILTWRAREPDRAAAGWYLAGVGALAIGAYIATRPADGLVIRYLLLAVCLPMGIVAAHVALETRRAWLALPVCLVALSAATASVDHARLLAHFARGEEPNETRALAAALEGRGIHVAESGYWRAYKLSFLTREQVKVASTDVVRIDEYQRLARAAGANLVAIEDAPCPGGDRVSLWYLCRAR
jgi:hypothetical protein